MKYEIFCANVNMIIDQCRDNTVAAADFGLGFVSQDVMSK